MNSAALICEEGVVVGSMETKAAGLAVDGVDDARADVMAASELANVKKWREMTFVG
jgi:hypothetical protein